MTPIDLSDTTIPTTSVPSEYAELAARVIAKKARSDADRIILSEMLGVSS